MNIALWIGLSCLHCLQPEANRSAISIMKTLQECSKPVSTSILLSGFTYDFERFKSLVDYLKPSNMVIVYVHAGSRQRKCRFYSDICVSTMHKKFDRYVDKYRDDLISFEPAIQYLISKGLIPVVIPALEDNYTDKEFEIIAGVTEEILRQDGPQIIFARNGLKNHWVPPGWENEYHSRKKAFSLSNDGKDISLSSAEGWKRYGTVFTLWSGDRQGYKPNRPILPHLRKYKTISSNERKRLVKFIDKR